MITRKDWNNLSPITRRRAAKMVFFNMGEEFQNNMAEEWHHNNDNWHSLLFGSLYWNKDKSEVKVVVGLGK